MAIEMGIGELARRAAKEGVPMAMIEKDYALTIIIEEIAGSGLKDALVFKGGTAIRKIHFPEARFSEDLDFTVIKLAPEGIKESIGRLFANKKMGGIEVLAVEHEKTAAGLRMALKVLGPLKHPQRIRLDFSFREMPSAPIKCERIIGDYGANRCRIAAMGLEEMLAEKLRAISSRSAPRDLYDIWFLMDKGVKIDKRLVAKKFAVYGEKFELGKAKTRVGGFRANWDRDLRQLMRQVPPFETAEKYVIERLEKEFA